MSLYLEALNFILETHSLTNQTFSWLCIFSARYLVSLEALPWPWWSHLKGEREGKVGQRGLRQSLLWSASSLVVYVKHACPDSKRTRLDTWLGTHPSVEVYVRT